ncbi:MAG: V-type ATP synthase subunit I [Natronomonas sp.]
MLRPERMSRVSITGSKRVLDETIETVHELNLLHLTDYDATWEGFEPGNPMEGAEEVAEKLVTVRALESTLEVDREDAGPTRIVDEDELETELESIRTEVNELDDRRSDLRDELRLVEDRIETARPLAELGLDLDLLVGYDSLSVAIGEGDEAAIRESLANADDVEAFETFAAEGYVAIFVSPAIDVENALVGTTFTEYEIPDPEDIDASNPAAYIEGLRHRKQQLESRLETVQRELQDLRLEVGGFLVAVEEQLSIEVQKLEAPLAFATTKNAFVAEGWIPTDRYEALANALKGRLGESVDVEELERAEYKEGHAHDREPADTEEGVAADGGEAVAPDGGYAMSGGRPPVLQDNAKAAKPFELLVGIINRPRYSELDPTLILFLTFPAFFGFMIGDVGYGILYILMGYVLLDRFDSAGIRSLGGVALWAGIFTTIFGFLYGEFFGLHEIGYIVYGSAGAPMDKGLSPDAIAFAWAWLVVSLLVALVHLSIGYIFGFIDDLSHGILDAAAENLSWLMLMLGVWAWVFSTHLKGVKPLLLYSTFNAEGAVVELPDGAVTVESHQVAYELGFAGLPESVGLAALGVAGFGFLFMLYGETLHMGKLGIVVGILESLNVLVNVLSYARIAAVLLAKGGMAFVVNLLVLGAYEDHGSIHFLYNNGYSVADGQVIDASGQAVGGEILFPGLLTDASGAMFVVAILVGGLIFVLGHVIVLLLGITAAGLQGIRLEYVEFFGKFYEGGGKPYSPFGFERQFTSDD